MVFENLVIDAWAFFIGPVIPSVRLRTVSRENFFANGTPPGN